MDMHSTHAPSLPFDVTFYIYQYDTQDPSRYAIWSLVNPAFRIACQKQLFKHITYNIHPAIVGSPLPPASYLLADDLVRCNRTLATYVKSLHVKCDTADADVDIDIDDPDTDDRFPNQPLSLHCLEVLQNCEHVSFDVATYVPRVALESIVSGLVGTMKRSGTTRLAIRQLNPTCLHWVAGLHHLRVFRLETVEGHPQFTIPLTHVPPPAASDPYQSALAAYIATVSRPEDFVAALPTTPPNALESNNDGFLELLEFDRHSIASIATLCYSATLPTSSLKFDRIETLVFRGVDQQLIQLAQLIGNRAQSTLRHVQWALLRDGWAPTSHNDSLPFFIPPKVTSMYFVFGNADTDETLAHLNRAIRHARTMHPAPTIKFIEPVLREDSVTHPHFVEAKLREIANGLKQDLPPDQLHPHKLELGWTDRVRLDQVVKDEHSKRIEQLWFDIVG
ncbi:hypothetical protein FPV67DRAFT_1678293 [Lyophyllum atratum]|nr:hypothetical protein FPV67DRAFT_1678293 [Lyophyllum atratum]